MPVKKMTVKKTVAGPASLKSRSLAPARSSKSLRSEESRGGIASSSSRRASGLSVPVYSLLGRAAGILSLPKEIFGVEVKKSLLNQAIRVYQTNQKNLTAATKTRGEVRGSTAKIYRQKGTGRARHGAKKAPIFVGGGITFGPRPRNVRLDLPKKMKRAALLMALSTKMGDKRISGVSGLEKATGKTKEMDSLIKKINTDKSALILTDKKIDNVLRSSRNIPGVNVLPADQVNAYEVLKHQNLLITKEAVEALKK